MERLLERLDSAASQIVPLLYLAGLMAGTLAYFTDMRMGFTLTVGVALAVAAEAHSFLQQRRVRALWARYSRGSLDEDTREALYTQLWVQAAILAGLVGFSAYNATAFIASTWTPAPGWLPAWVQVGVRGLVVPVLFLLTGALSPLSTDASAVLAHASHEMLHHTIKTTVRQWRGRIKRARRRNLNLAPVAIALMLDAGDADGARRIHMIDAGLARAEAGVASGDALALDAPTLAGLFTPTPTPTPTPLAPVELASTPNGGDDPTPDGGPDRGPDRGPTGGKPRPSSSRGSSRPDSRPGGSSRGEGLRLVGETPRRDSGMTRAQQEALYQRDMALAAEILAGEPVMSTRELARRLSVERRFPCHPGRAATIRRALTAEAPDGQARKARVSV